MYEKIGELLSCPKSTQESVRLEVPGWWVEMLPVLTCVSQSDTYSQGIWHLGYGSTRSPPLIVPRFSGEPENHPRAGSLDLGFRWGKLPSLLLVLKSGHLVGPVAKGLVRRVPATAQGDGGASGEAVRLALHIHQVDFPFDAQRAVISNDYLC